jgi:hypothetical protein
MTAADWGGDTTPSLPESLKRKKYLTFGGFCWTATGIAHDLSDAEVDALRIPPFAPSYPVDGKRS